MGITVAELVLRVAVENGGVKKGVDEAQHQVERFSQGAGEQGRRAGEHYSGGFTSGMVRVAAGAGLLLVGKITQGVRGTAGLIRGAFNSIFGFTGTALTLGAVGLDRIAESTRKANGELTTTGKVCHVASTGL